MTEHPARLGSGGMGRGNELSAARQLHGATPTSALENHDIVRPVTRLGGGELVRCGPRSWRCWVYPARRISIRGRNSGFPRSTSRWRLGWIQSRLATAAPGASKPGNC
ncbi:hypothetical protein J2X01_002906 [Arthrobacter ginsengisoli]|uniref:Uncharacterized protein n=1 Tax=Arthrobacter ginsengisoli TaxID=1356565 RepID=A0ABU1UEJ3_9MICC|nr:hypothetical protein [Arthrobacter ginsengisoli]MDR7083611.1 hypothetical protein [Arthrobacter ginsengisoli]